MQIDKSQLEDKRVMLQTRFIEFPALSVDSEVGFARSASETNDRYFVLPIIITKFFWYIFFEIFRINSYVTANSERHFS